MVGWGSLEGKLVIVFYDDNISINRKEGVLDLATKTDIFISTKAGIIAIPFNRIVRVEEVIKNGGRKDNTKGDDE